MMMLLLLLLLLLLSSSLSSLLMLTVKMKGNNQADQSRESRNQSSPSLQKGWCFALFLDCLLSHPHHHRHRHHTSSTHSPHTAVAIILLCCLFMLNKRRRRQSCWHAKLCAHDSCRKVRICSNTHPLFFRAVCRGKLGGQLGQLEWPR